MRVRLSQAGMSLIEVMIAVSILSVIMVGVMTMSQNMDKQSKNAEKRTDIEGLMMQIQQTMSDKDHCSATVMGAAAGVNSTTIISGIKQVSPTGFLVSPSTLRVSSITAATETRNNTIINGMYLTNRGDHGNGANYDLVITFVKNPLAAAGRAKSAANTMNNYITRKIPLNLDNCTRTVYWKSNLAPGTLTCPGVTQQIGTTPITITSSSAAHPGETFNVIVCRDCSARTTVRGCN